MRKKSGKTNGTNKMTKKQLFLNDEEEKQEDDQHSFRLNTNVNERSSAFVKDNKTP